MVDVTVIIPAHNMSDTIERAITSAYKAGADEVMVFDDASTDNITSVLSGHRHSLAWSRFRVGVSYARNTLIQHAKYDWIIPLDADDELLDIPDPKDCRPDEFYYGGWIEYREVGTEETFIAPPSKMIKLKPLCHATMMFTKQAWLEVGGYDPDFFYGEDYAFQCALINMGWNAVHCDIPLYRRYIGKNERTEKAKKYWPIILDMAKEKYPSVFL